MSQVSTNIKSLIFESKAKQNHPVFWKCKHK